MAIFVPNSPLAGFNIGTGSLQGPAVVLDDLTGASTSTFLIAGGAVGDEFFISASNFNVKANGNITASNALLAGTITATAGFIGGWTIGSSTLQGGNVILDSTGNIRTATNFTTGDGFFFNDQATNNFRVGLAGGSRLQFTGDNIEIYSSNTRVVSLGTVNDIAGFGLTPTAISSSNNNLVLKSNGQITGSSVLFNGGRIGGFTIDATKITGSNIIIDSAGSIQTANYASDLSGWKIDAAGNGTAEFENVKIRGTLSTAVFEKQSVNAVGGQLYVANSTTLTGSNETGASTNGQYTATQTTMSVENVTGFEAGEIVSAKRFSGTGFATEYMRIDSASRANPSSQTDFSGRIYVTRGLGNGVTGTSGSLGETPSAGQSYSGSQVIVSTGKSGSGFIRINANPSDTATPYIDIVERTGSGIYDIALKARLGDLSGLANSSYVFGRSNPGFGLATDNVFLQGGIIANTGSIGGISMQSGKLFTGTGTFNNNNTGFYLDASSNFSLGNKLSWNGSTLSVSGTLNATDGNIGGFTIGASALTATDFSVNTTAGEIELGSATTFAAGDGIYMSKASTNNFRVGDAGGARMQFTGTNLEIYNSSNTKLVSVGASNTLAGFTLSDSTLSNSTNFFISGSSTGDGFFISASNFNVKANGSVTASSMLLVSNEPSTLGYQVFNSSQGVLDAYNIGKQVYSSPVVYDFNTSTGGTYAAPTYVDFSPTLTGSFYLLPGETSAYFVASGRVSPNTNNSASLNCKLLIYAEPGAATTLTGGGSQVATASWSSNLDYIRTTIKTTKGRNTYKSQAADLSGYTAGALFTWKLQYAFFENTIATGQLGNITIMTAREFQTAYSPGTEA